MVREVVFRCMSMLSIKILASVAVILQAMIEFKVDTIWISDLYTFHPQAAPLDVAFNFYSLQIRYKSHNVL